LLEIGEARGFGPSDLEGVVFAVFFRVPKFACVSSSQQHFKMIWQGSLSVEKCPTYHDLNTPNWKDLVDTPLELFVASHISSELSSTSNGKKKKMSTCKKNPY
jgi:hypothetical protein